MLVGSACFRFVFGAFAGPSRFFVPQQREVDHVADAVAVGELASGIAYATHLAGFAIGLVAGAAWKEFALDTDRLIADLSDEASS